MATHTVTIDNFEDTIANNAIVVLDFWASWCGPCRTFGPIFEAASNKHADVFFGKIDTEAQQELAAAFGIQSIPTTAWFREGIMLHSESGLLPAEGVEDLLRQLRALDMDEVRATIAANQAPES